MVLGLLIRFTANHKSAQIPIKSRSSACMASPPSLSATQHHTPCCLNSGTLSTASAHQLQESRYHGMFLHIQRARTDCRKQKQNHTIYFSGSGLGLAKDFLPQVLMSVSMLPTNVRGAKQLDWKKVPGRVVLASIPLLLQGCSCARNI